MRQQLIPEDADVSQDFPYPELGKDGNAVHLGEHAIQNGDEKSPGIIEAVFIETLPEFAYAGQDAFLHEGVDKPGASAEVVVHHGGCHVRGPADFRKRRRRGAL